MNKKDLGIFIKERRQKLNISQLDLANTLNITTQAISRWENGLSYPDFIILGELSNILKLSLDDLLNLKNNNEYIEKRVFNYSSFGLTIKKYQKNLNLSQFDLANKLNVNQTTISNIINGKTFPSINQFIELCKIFNINYSDLYYSNFIIKKNENKKKNYLTFIIPSFVVILLLIFLINLIIPNNRTSSTNNEYTPYIEFLNSSNKVIENKKYKHNEEVVKPIYTTLMGYNKEIKPATHSTIYRENKNPHKLTIAVNYDTGGRQYHYYDSLKDFNQYKIVYNGYYCKELKHKNGTLFDINNINNNFYELYAKMEPIKTNTIYFPSYLNINPFTIRTKEHLYELPNIYKSDSIIIKYKYNNLIFKKNSQFLFDESITLEPIIYSQKTTINSEGYITHLSSNEEEIIIPDSIDNIKVKGIKSNAIHLNNENKIITFMNESPIEFKDVFYNPSLIGNVKEINILYSNFYKDSYLGNIEHLDKIYTSFDSKIISYNIYELWTLSNNPNFKIKNLEYYSNTNNLIFFNNLNVDDVYCLDEYITSFSSNLFSCSSLKRLHFKSTLLTDSIATNIESSAFKYCENLEYFEFPNNTYLIGDNHFENCDNLSSIYFYGYINCLANNMFSNTNIKEITSFYKIDKIKQDAFENTNISKVEVANVNIVENYLYVPNSLTDIYLGGKFDNEFIIRNNLNTCIHYLDHNVYETINTSYSSCFNCLHLHKGDY